MKKRKSKIALSVLAGLVAGISFLSGCATMRTSRGINVLTDESYSAEGIHSIEIYGKSSDIEILPSTDGQFHVYETYHAQAVGISSNIQPCLVETSRGVFRLEEGSADIKVFIGSFERRIDIYLPDNTWESYTTQLRSGDFSCDDITASQITLDVNSGDLSMRNLTADRLDADLKSGNIKVRSLVTDHLNIDVSSGDFGVQDLTAKQLELEIRSGTLEIEANTLPDDIDLEVASGDFRLQLPEESEFSVDYRVSSGDIYSDFDHSFHEGSGKTGSGGPVYNVRLSSGTVHFDD